MRQSLSISQMLKHIAPPLTNEGKSTCISTRLALFALTVTGCFSGSIIVGSSELLLPLTVIKSLALSFLGFLLIELASRLKDSRMIIL